jgi:hypothetical protein
MDFFGILRCELVSRYDYNSVEYDSTTGEKGEKIYFYTNGERKRYYNNISGKNV